MSNVPNVNFNKIPNKGVQFNQKEYYEDNFDKINDELVSNVNAQLNDIEKSKIENFKLKNEVVNGDFSQGTVGWFGGGYTVVGGEGYVDGSKSGTIVYQPCLIANNKHYIRFKLRKINANSVQLYCGGSNVFIYNKGEIIDSYISSVFNPLNTNGNLALGCTLGAIFYFDKFTLIDLTSVFGAGNEPTKLEMDELMKVIPNGWWDGELTLTQKQFITWQLNLIRKNTNAIIALGGTI